MTSRAEFCCRCGQFTSLAEIPSASGSLSHGGNRAEALLQLAVAAAAAARGGRAESPAPAAVRALRIASTAPQSPGLGLANLADRAQPAQGRQRTQLCATAICSLCFCYADCGLSLSGRSLIDLFSNKVIGRGKCPHQTDQGIRTLTLVARSPPLPTRRSASFAGVPGVDRRSRDAQRRHVRRRSVITSVIEIRRLKVAWQPSPGDASLVRIRADTVGPQISGEGLCVRS